jgi:hypothetical protein
MNDLQLFAGDMPVFSAEVLEYAKSFNTTTRMPHISTRGSRFNFMRNGQLEGIAQTLYLDVVVLAQRAAVSRLWFAGQFDPNATEKLKPACWSIDGVTPGAPAEQRPAVTLTNGAQRPVNSCAECPNNIKGSAANGKGKACAYKQTLIVAAPDKLDEVWRLDVSGMGVFGESQPDKQLRSWSDYKSWLASRPGMPGGVPPFAVITRLSFDARQSVPALQFSVATTTQGGAAWLSTVDITRVIDRAKQADVVAELELPEADEVPVALLAASAAEPSMTPPSHVQAYAQPAAAAVPATTLTHPLPAAATPAATAPSVAGQPLGLNHPDVPQEVRDWAASPGVTQTMIDEYLRDEYPEALEPPAAAATVAPAAPPAPPAPPKRKRRTKEQIAADNAAAAAAAAAAVEQPPVATPVAAPVSAPVEAPVASPAATPAVAPAAADGNGIDAMLSAKMSELLGGGFDDQ